MNMKKCDMCGKVYKPDMGVKLSVSGVIPKGASVPDVQWEMGRYRLYGLALAADSRKVTDTLDLCPNCYSDILYRIYGVQEKHYMGIWTPNDD